MKSFDEGAFPATDVVKRYLVAFVAFSELKKKKKNLRTMYERRL